jgi:hypothetical protein
MLKRGVPKIELYRSNLIENLLRLFLKIDCENYFVYDKLIFFLQ